MSIKFDELLEALDPSLDIDESLKEGFENESLNESCDGWIAIYNGRKVEIPKSEASGIYDAKQKAIKQLKVPKSKIGLLAIKPAYKESYNSKKLKEAWEAEFESAYDDLMNDDSLSEKEKDEALKQLFAEFGFNESLNESKSSESILNELGDRIATGLRKEGFDAFFDYPRLTVMNTSYGLHVVNTPSVSVETENGKHVMTCPINTHNASTEAVSKIVKTIVKSLRK